MPTVIDKIAWVHLMNRRLLAVRNYGRPVFYLPGGQRESGESDIETLKREILEEVQVYLLPTTIQFFGRFEFQAYGKTEGTIVRSTCYTASFKGTPSPANEIEEIAFLSSRESSRCSITLQRILNLLKEKDLID